MQRYRIDDDDNDAGHDTSRADSGDCSADDEGHRSRGRAANGRSSFEQEDGSQEDCLDAEEGIELAEEQLEGAVGEEVGTAIPANVGNRVEIISNAGDRRGDDQPVLVFVLVEFMRPTSGVVCLYVSQ